MSKLRLTIVALLAFSHVFASSVFYGDVTELKRILIYPKESQDYYFRPLVDLANLGSYLFAVENLRNRVIAFKLEYPKLTYAFDVGRPGQGTGDLMHPISLSIWNDEIAVKESGFFSIFDKNGKSLSKFRIFADSRAFVYQDNKIYWLNPNLEENHLIEVYQKAGERIFTMGTKFIKANSRAFINPPRIEGLLYEGRLFSDGKTIIYFSSRFGKYFVFSLGGEALREGDINTIFGERGKKISKYNQDVYIERTKKEDQHSGYPFPLIFEDGCLHKDEIYFINSSIIQKTRPKTIIELKIISLKSMNLLSEYIIEKDGVIRIDSLEVIEINNEPYILLSISVMEQGYYLELYRR